MSKETPRRSPRNLSETSEVKPASNAAEASKSSTVAMSTTQKTAAHAVAATTTGPSSATAVTSNTTRAAAHPEAATCTAGQTTATAVTSNTSKAAAHADAAANANRTTLPATTKSCANNNSSNKLPATAPHVESKKTAEIVSRPNTLSSAVNASAEQIILAKSNSCHFTGLQKEIDNLQEQLRNAQSALKLAQNDMTMSSSPFSSSSSAPASFHAATPLLSSVQLSTAQATELNTFKAAAPATSAVISSTSYTAGAALPTVHGNVTSFSSLANVAEVNVERMHATRTRSPYVRENGNAVEHFAESYDGPNYIRSQPTVGNAVPTNFYPANCQTSPMTYSVSSQDIVHRKIHDLPEFTGTPEDWPMFSTAFTQSSAVYKYNNFENCQRLQKALKGNARECVKSLLIHPDNVASVMELLYFQFGRPELLIRSQLQLVRNIAPITESGIEKLVPFATKARNLAVFLQSANGRQHLSNPTLLEELIGKLPMSKRVEWARYAAPIQPYPTIVDFSNWVNEVANFIRVVQDNTNYTAHESKRKIVLHATDRQRAEEVECPICQGRHRASDCRKFVALSLPDRWKAAKQYRMCFCCLKVGHTTRGCRSRKLCLVEECQRKHHQLLHERKPTVAISPAQQKAAEATEAVLSCITGASDKNEMLFRVLPVTIYSENKRVDTYALLDEGSSVTMIDSALIKDLGVQGRQTQLNIHWYGGKAAHESATVVDLQISGLGKRKRHVLRNVYGVSHLDLPTQSVNKNFLNANVRDLPVSSYVNATPKVLIGLDHCHLGLPEEIIALSKGGPYAANTPLGWLVFGQMAGEAVPTHSCLLTKDISEQSLLDVVADYFEVENFGVKICPVVESEEEIRSRNILQQTTKRVNGRFQTGLLWRKPDVVLPDSYSLAKKRLLSIEHKMRKDEKFSNAYKQIINDYVIKGYARKLSLEEVAVVGPRTWYLPHFAVVNHNKPGKIRLVFDAAATVDGVSLNSSLFKGPQQYRPMPAVLFNFRVGVIAVCGDITEMFHQVLIAPEDRCAQRFLWRNGDASSDPEVYEMEVMIFGAACSPCAAQYVKVINALEHKERFPRAVRSIIDHHYVDDFVDSFATETKAIEITEQVREIHKAAGFKLSKFSSNSSVVVAALAGKPNELVEFSNKLPEMSLLSEKILGMYWQPANDTFSYLINFHRIDNDVISGMRCPTKRELLSIVMSVFDPIGFLCNFMITAKLMMREVWRHDRLWDEPLPSGILETWSSWQQNMKRVVEVRIPRCYFRSGIPRDLQIHIFVDASEDAFAAVAYWRSVSAENIVETSFICAKTKCAPLKPMSVPRLELQAAVLGTRIMHTIIKEHNLNITRCVLWSDSSTVINWIRSESRRYKPFVAHRIAEILDGTEVSNWKWVPTEENVADEATKLNQRIEFHSKSRWFTGPEFLLNDEEKWPSDPGGFANQIGEEELRPKFSLLAVSHNIVHFNRFSCLNRLKRTTAWVLRFIRRCRHKNQADEEFGLTSAELSKAEIVLCLQAQNESYCAEIALIKGGNHLAKGSELHKLMPYIDNDNILRVYGRIDAASWLPLDTRRPIILPPEHMLTKLVVAYYHQMMKHQNHEATICEVRKKFWIPRLRQIMRKVVSRCQVCKLRRVLPEPPMMGSLPKDRLTPFVRPFSYTGLDYFGPLSISIGRRREKRWVALFTCLTVRAIHLEVAYDLSTDACILTIRNFINRRGTPVKIRSDNGKNFVGVEQEAKRFQEVFDAPSIQAELSSRGIEWEFNCPYNPSEGGVWERMVQCVKKVLRHTLRESAPREHTLQSFLIEAENVVNSRPLTHLPISAGQEEPLTPNHFLLGSANTAQTAEQVVADKPVGLRKQWRIARQLKNIFWKRWIAEYLPTLTRRSKWCQRSTPIKEGDLVYICDASVPRRQWRRGMVENVYCAADGVIRRADVRTSNGVLRRPVSKLAVLDVE